MKRWLSGIRGTVVMVLIWTVGWGLGFGGLIEAFVDPSGKIVDIWLTVMAIPGFIGGVVISTILLVAEGGRTFDEVSLLRFTTWGVVTGLVVGVVIALTTKVPGAVTLTAQQMVGIMAALGAVAGIGSAVFFRLLARNDSKRVLQA